MLNMWWRIWETGTWVNTDWHRNQIRFKIVQGILPTMLFNAKLFHMIAIQKTIVSIASVLVQIVEHKLGFKLQQNNDNVKILSDDQIVLFSCRKRYLVHLDLDLGSVIFPHQLDSPVHHVSTFIPVSSPVPVSWHFPLTACFSAFRPVFPPPHKPWWCFPAGF